MRRQHPAPLQHAVNSLHDCQTKQQGKHILPVPQAAHAIIEHPRTHPSDGALRRKRRAIDNKGIKGINQQKQREKHIRPFQAKCPPGCTSKQG